MSDITADIIDKGREALCKARLSGLNEDDTVVAIYLAMQKAAHPAAESDRRFVPDDYDFEAVI